MQLLELFDQANPNECYRRRDSVVPQQALAMVNSALSLDRARILAQQISAESESDATFISAAFEHVLGRTPSNRETESCQRFLERQSKLLNNSRSLTPYSAGGGASVAPASDPNLRARQNLVHVLFSHNDFVTIR